MRCTVTPNAEAAALSAITKLAICRKAWMLCWWIFFLEAHTTPLAQIVLDLDVTDTPLHGEQEQRFFHGYYGHYCYLPLYIFCGEHLLCARQRCSNQDASAGGRQEVERIVEQIRSRWPQVDIILRADPGFCREELMAWCEAHQVRYVLGLAHR